MCRALTLELLHQYEKMGSDLYLGIFYLDLDLQLEEGFYSLFFGGLSISIHLKKSLLH